MQVHTVVWAEWYRNREKSYSNLEYGNSYRNPEQERDTVTRLLWIATIILSLTRDTVTRLVWIATVVLS